jgi:hypothetical protein
MPIRLDSIQADSVLDIRKLSDVLCRVVWVILAAQFYTRRFDDASGVLDQLRPGALPFGGLGVFDLVVVCVAVDSQLRSYEEGLVLPHICLLIACWPWR